MAITASWTTTIVAVPAVILILFAADFSLTLTYLANSMAGHSINGLNALVDLNGEGNLPTWYSSVKLFAVAASFGLLSRIERPFVGSWLFALLALAFLGLSADETVQIHESVGTKLDIFLPGGDRENTVVSKTGIWMFVIGIPAVAAMAFLFWYARSYLRIAPEAFIKYFIGLVVFAIGAMGMETLSNFVAGEAYVAVVAAEELLEMLGVTILLWACLDLLQARNVRLEVDRPQPFL